MRARPTVRQHPAITHIRRDDNASREGRTHLSQPIGILERPRSDDNALSSVIEQSLNRVPASYSSSDLNFGVCCAEDPADFRVVVAAKHDPVEIDDVQMVKSVLPPCESNADWVRDSDQLLVVGVSSKLDTGSTTQVERGNCDHLERSDGRAWIIEHESVEMIACRRACE